MSLIDTISRLFKRSVVEASADTAQETEQKIGQVREPTELAWKLRAEHDRARLVHLCNEMYETDPRCEGAINTLARDIAKGGFDVKSDDQRAADVAKALIERLRLQSVLDDYARETLIEGDTFVEAGVNAERQIASITRKPTLHMQRNTDRTDRFSDPRRAFWYAEQSRLYTTLEPPSDAVWFAEWQIIHLRWNHRSKRKYGRPLFASATSAWKRVNEGELDIAVRRKTRAGMKFLHIVEGADAAGIEKYKEDNKAALDNPFAASIDLFSNKPGSITAIQGDAKLSEIDDVVHHIETWWTASPVPMVLIGYGKDLNRDVLEQKLTQYERSLESLTQWMEDEFVRPLLEREWLLNGIFPDALKYELVWRYKSPSTSTDLRNVADAILRFKALNIPDAIINAIVARFLPWLDITALLEAQTAEQPSVDTQPARLNTVLGATA